MASHPSLPSWIGTAQCGEIQNVDVVVLGRYKRPSRIYPLQQYISVSFHHCIALHSRKGLTPTAGWIKPAMPFSSLKAKLLMSLTGTLRLARPATSTQRALRFPGSLRTTQRNSSTSKVFEVRPPVMLLQKRTPVRRIQPTVGFPLASPR